MTPGTEVTGGYSARAPVYSVQETDGSGLGLMTHGPKPAELARVAVAGG